MSQEKSWRDKLKEGQSKFASLDAEFTAFCKKNPETGTPEMFVTKGEVKKKVDSLSGFLIGSYMKIGAYNNTLKIGGNSTPYFTLDDIVTVYEKNQKIYSGTARGAKEFVVAHFKLASAKVSKIFVLATPHGLVALETNSTLAMRDDRKIRAYSGDYMITFTPKMYDPATDYEKSMNENYKTLSLRPCFAVPTQGPFFSEEVENSMDMNSFVTRFKDFESQIRSNTSVSHIDATPAPEAPAQSLPVAEAPAIPPSFQEDDSDELPF